MSVSLKELFQDAGYDFEDLEDLHKVQSMLYEVEELGEEVDEKVEELEAEKEAEEAGFDEQDYADFQVDLRRDLEMREELGIF